MKNKVIVAKENNEIRFYLKNDRGLFWLFTQPYSKGVYEWFKDGRAENEILNFTKWEKNKRLSNNIKRISRAIKYVNKYIIDEERVA